MSGTEHGEAASLNPNCDRRPARGGWAPGNYMALCGNCRQSFIGDKRAVMCADCAYIGTDRPDDERLVLALLELNTLRKDLASALESLRGMRGLLAEARHHVCSIAADDQNSYWEHAAECVKKIDAALVTSQAITATSGGSQ